MKKEGVKKTLVRNASVLKRFIAFIADLLIINSIILFPFRNTINKILPNKDSFSETFNYLSSYDFINYYDVCNFFAVNPLFCDFREKTWPDTWKDVFQLIC